MLPEYNLLAKSVGWRRQPLLFKNKNIKYLFFLKRRLGPCCKMSEESKQKYLVSQPTSIKIEVLGRRLLETNITPTYISVRAAAKAIRCPHTTIFKK